MEQQQWREAILAFNSSPTLSLLTSLHSLIANSSTSDLTISSILTTLTSSLSPHHRNRHHVFSLLAAIAAHRPYFSGQITAAVRDHGELTADALSLFLSIAAVDSVNDVVLVSLCFQSCVAVRVWILRNASRFKIRPNLLVTVFLGFTKDPFPYVRVAALEGLVDISRFGGVVEDRGTVEGCYFRGVELLKDVEDCVRAGAVRLVSEWGKMLGGYLEEGEKRDFSDGLFLQLCSVVRDMSVEVRVEAFNALGKIELVSEDILLQSLSKKVLGIIKEKKLLGLGNARHYELHASTAAGVFVHGLEDEYSKVQRAACKSMCMLTKFSSQFAGEATNFLADILNDDSMVVRLEALITMHHMARFDCLKTQQEHMHQLLGTLVDNNAQIRRTTMKILGLVKLPDRQLFKLTVESLLEILDIYAQDEAEVFRSLFNIAQTHGNHAVSIFKDVYDQIKPSQGGKLDFNSARVAGLLVLAISASLTGETCFRHVPRVIFSYAAVFLGRISHAFSDVMNQDTLLAYLSRCGDLVPNPQSRCETEVPAFSPARHQREMGVDVIQFLNFILETVKSSWQLVTSGFMSEATKVLRSCKEELENPGPDFREFSGTVAFILEYITIVELLTKLWNQCLGHRIQQCNGTGGTNILFKELEEQLLALRYRFIGLSKSEELHVLELVLVSCLLRLSRVHVCHRTFQKLSNTISHINLLRKAEPLTCSVFVNQISELVSEDGSDNVPLYSTHVFKNLLDLFSFMDFVPSRGVQQVKAELDGPGFDPENPLPFILGFPIGVPFEITLYNVDIEFRLWVKMSIGEELTQFVFVELDRFGDSDGIHRQSFRVPFYGSPKANAFTLKVCIGMECLSEDPHLMKVHGGPKHALTYLCQEKEIAFVCGH